MSKRVLLAGLFHETHTFLDDRTSVDDFQIRRGDELLSAQGDGSPLAGMLQVADAEGWDVLPTVDMRATPSGTVEDSVLDFFWDEFRRRAEPQLSRGIDGIYLVLHGAMATASVRDVEGEVIRRIRGLPGASDVPIGGVMDMHGNISKSSVTCCQTLVAYRTNPHVDAHDAAVRGAALLDRILATGRKPVMVWAQAPVMWPPTGTGTDDDPLRALEAHAREIERCESDIPAVNVFAGFSFADTPDTGVSFSAVTFGDAGCAQAQLEDLCEWTVAHREQGAVAHPQLADVMSEICARADRGGGPIVVVEPADNVGGGAPGDGTSVLRALVAHGVRNSAVVINDPSAVERLRGLTRGARLSLRMGGRGSRLTEGPYELEVQLLSTSDGRFELEDPHSHLASMSGMHIEMGPCAVVEHGGVRVLLTSHKTPPFDLGQLRSQGIEPETLAVIGVKAAVAHRRAYDKIARASYTVSTPGPCSSDLTSFAWQHVRRPIFPLDEIA